VRVEAASLCVQVVALSEGGRLSGTSDNICSSG